MIIISGMDTLESTDGFAEMIVIANGLIKISVATIESSVST